MDRVDRNKLVRNCAKLFNEHYNADVQMCEHIKTGNLYFILYRDVINATNERDGQKMILYSDGANIYVREKAEFYDKFVQPNELNGEDNEHN